MAAGRPFELWGKKAGVWGILGKGLQGVRRTRDPAASVPSHSPGRQDGTTAPGLRGLRSPP